jgi:hypothetical protein
MNHMKQKTILLVLTIGFLGLYPVKDSNASNGGNEPLSITSTFVENAFPIVYQKKAAVIYIDTTDAEVVSIAAIALQKDIQLLTKIQPTISGNQTIEQEYPIIIGTLGKSAIVGQLVKSKKIDVSEITGKWETFLITVVDNPLKGVKKALVITGSDRRGTAFGVFELSKMMGISPWVWWADVTPSHKESIFITTGTGITGPPSVKYRGIFLNDEDWGLQPWAAQHMDPNIQDIGPNTYAHIFELMLRLKANFIWPAMHICTKAFYYYPENPKIAEKYAIVVGSSHCEPILRNNVFEWTLNFEHEYGTKPNEWRYDTNKEQIYRYWDDRAKQSSNYESIYTIGMRGIHDSSMPGAKTIEDKVQLLNKVIIDQRDILLNHKNKPITEIPQIFCPYKEVLTLYQNGLKVPEDITIVWADDNHGYIRQLSNQQEQKRNGRSGVYYHFSYWGSPYDYQWLSSISPSLTAYEMTKAYSYGADRLWIFNVGDIKPAELETEFAMDMAWNINQWRPENAYTYVESWAARTFGSEFAVPISKIKSEYYRLAQNGKPEHLGVLNFSDKDIDKRISDYQQLLVQAEELKAKIPSTLQDAYFQLILYPVKGAALLNEKIFYARKSINLAKKGDGAALAYSQKALVAFKEIQNITNYYNQNISNGKWSGMMSYIPRNLAVFKMPQVATSEMVKSFSPSALIPDSNSFVNGKYDVDLVENRVTASTEARIIIPATSFSVQYANPGETIQGINGLGISNSGISLFPFTTKSVPDSLAVLASYVEYKAVLNMGPNTIVVKALPTHAIQKERGIRYAISVNNDPIQVVDLNFSAENPVWKENVLRGYTIGQTNHQVNTQKGSVIRVYLLDPGLVINQIEIK